MKFKVIPSKSFEKDAKPLLKKYLSLSNELREIGKLLSENPTLGKPLGKNCFKLRLAIKSKGKGKSGGSRVITYVITEKKEVILLTIYDKSTKSDLEPKELDFLLKSFEMAINQG